MNKICLAAATAAAAFLLSACSTGSKYYQHDGPPSSSAELDTSSATPRVEHFYPASLRPYTVMGQRYVPVTSDVKMDQTGIASWDGKQFHGNKTAIGETYNMHAMSAAHPTMPLPSYARITNLENGRSVIVRVNDLGRLADGQKRDAQHLINVADGDELDIRFHRIIDLVEIGHIRLGYDNGLYAAYVSRHGLLLESAYRQDSAAQGDFAGHRHISSDGGTCQRGDKRRGHRDTRGRAVLRDCALGAMNMYIFIFIEFAVYSEHIGA